MEFGKEIKFMSECIYNLISDKDIVSTNIVKDCTELRKLIIENPDLPIAFCVSEDAGDYAETPYVYIDKEHISFTIGELLDCEVSWNNYIMFNDRDDFYERLSDHLLDLDDTLYKLSDEEFDKILDYNAKKFEPYWKKAILVTID